MEDELRSAFRAIGRAGLTCTGDINGVGEDGAGGAQPQAGAGSGSGGSEPKPSTPK